VYLVYLVYLANLVYPVNLDDLGNLVYH